MKTLTTGIILALCWCTGIEAAPAKAADAPAQGNPAEGTPVVADKLYQETYRPQFHYTTQQGWINDPIGLVFYKGQYHLFNDHNPASCRFPGGRTSGEQSHWSHAVSPDLVHWKQMPIAVFPDSHGACWSGSGVVDWNNTAGFQAGEDKSLVLLYTSAGETFTQSLVYSTDRGRTFTKYEKNPVLGHIAGSNRDPKVLWHAPTKKWVMALFLDKNNYALFGSPDLKTWERLCDVLVPGAGECPDFFELPIDGNPKNTRWVFWGANNTYLLGTFDGKTFEKESGPHPSNWGGNCYAAQTWSDILPSDGRRLQIAWMSGGKYPGMPFNQQMSFPTELALRTTPEGVRLTKKPVREIENIHAKKHSWASRALAPGGENLLSGLEGELFDIRAEIELGQATEVGFTLRGQKVRYDAAAKEVTALGKKAPLAPIEGRIRLQILLDRTSIEVYGNDGLISMPTCFLPDLANRTLAVYAEGGEARIVSLEVYELRSAWE